MLVERATFTASLGRWRELREVLVANAQRTMQQHKWRIYSKRSGEIGQFVIEVEFKDEHEREQFWTERLSKPENKAFHEVEFEPHLQRLELEILTLTHTSEAA